MRPADGNPAPPHRHMWFWAVLGPDARRVAVVGGAELSALLDSCGFDVVAWPGEAPDALLIGGGGAAGLRAVARAAERIEGATLLAIPLGGGPPAVAPGQSRAARARALLGSPVRGAAARARGEHLARRLRRSGLEVATLPTGERARPYALGPGGWRRHRRVPVGVVVAASRSRLPPSTAAAAAREAALALGLSLRQVGTSVLESGKLLTELVDPGGRRYILRLAGGPARPPLEHALWCQTELAAAPPSLRARIARPLAVGEVGLARYALEPKAAGRHPRRMTPRLWRECLDFLIELHALAHAPDAGLSDGVAAIAEQVRVVGAHADPAQRAVMQRVGDRLSQELGAVPLGWGHGDFWNENLLARRGRFELVVDWDWAAPRGLPLLDLFDLTALAERSTRDLPHGPRLLQVLWPLARAGGDERIRHYCAASGTPRDARTLEALAVAYWLARVARDLRPFASFRRRHGWLDQNIGAPLAALARAGW